MSSLPGCHFKAVFKVRTWTTGGRIWKLRICMTCMYINITFYLYISFYIILYLSICMDGFMDERTDWRTDGWMDDFMGGWMDWSIWNHNKSIKHNKPTQNKKHLPSHSDFKSFSLHQLTADIQQGLRLAKPQASRNWDQVRRETSRTISLHWELAIPKWLNSQTLRKRSEDLTRHPRTFHTSARQVPFWVHRSTPQDIQANTSVAEAGKFSQDFLSRKWEENFKKQSFWCLSFEKQKHWFRKHFSPNSSVHPIPSPSINHRQETSQRARTRGALAQCGAAPASSKQSLLSGK